MFRAEVADSTHSVPVKFTNYEFGGFVDLSL